MPGLMNILEAGAKKLAPTPVKAMASKGLVSGLAGGVQRLVKDPVGTTWNSVAPRKTWAVMHGLATKPLDTLRAGWKSKRFGWMGKAILGASIAPDALAMARPSRPGEPGKAQRVGNIAGGLVGGIAGSRLPMLGNLAVWTGSQVAGRAAGKAFGQVTGVGRAKKALPEEQPSVSAKLASAKTAETNEELRAFTKRLIRQRQVELGRNIERGDVATATTRDSVGTYERSASTAE